MYSTPTAILSRGNEHLPSAYHVPGAVLSILYKAAHVLMTSIYEEEPVIIVRKEISIY